MLTELAEYLSILNAVIESGSFSKASLELQLSQSTISRKIDELEQFLGVTLIQRTARGIKPNAEALKLYSSYKVNQDSLSAFLADLKNDANKFQGFLKVVLPTTFGYYAISPHVALFLQKNTEINLELIFKDHDVDLLNDDIDIVIMDHKPTLQNARYKHLYTASYGIYANAGFLDSQNKDYQTPTTISINADYSVNFDESNVFLHSQLLTNSSLANLTFAQNTSLHCSLPDVLAYPYCQQKLLVRLYDDQQIKEKSYYLVRTVAHVTPALKKVIGFIDDCVSKIDTSVNTLQLQ